MSGTEVMSFPDTVLVVDDEPIVVEVLSKVLPMKGLKVSSVGSAEAAVERMRADGFGCLLADKNLPGMNGIELIALTRKMQPHCACIVMTAYASTSSAVEALRLGAVDYLEKPFQDIELVAEKVRLALEHHRSVFHRQRLLNLLRVFQEELTAKERQVTEQRTEIGLFNQILELRVEDATRDLNWKVQELEKRIAGGASSRDGEIVGAEMALIILDDIQGKPETQPAVRAQIQRAVRQIEAHIKMLRSGKPA